ncbi:MAG: EamA family transporter [Rhodospirillaceae bacterium]|nr:EamA family transporter [Rhodospirillaceae bacterium]
MHEESPGNNNVNGIYCILLGMLVVTLQDCAVKWLSPDYALHLIMLIRSLIGLTIVFLLIKIEGGFVLLKTRNLGWQLLRATLLILANLTLFMAVASMPYAEAIALFFVAPLLITILSIPILGEQVGARRWSAVIVGLAGVGFMLRPSEDIFNWASFLPLAAAFSYASMQMLTRKIGATDKASTMSFYMQCTMIVTCVVVWAIIGDGRFAVTGHASLDFLLRAWTIPAVDDVWIFICCGILSGFGSYLLSQSYRLAQANLIAPFEYIALPLSVLLGFILWNEFPKPGGVFGMVLIVSAGLYTLYRERLRNNKIILD